MKTFMILIAAFIVVSLFATILLRTAWPIGSADVTAGIITMVCAGGFVLLTALVVSNKKDSNDSW